MPTPSSLFDVVLQVLATAIRQVKEIKGTSIRKKKNKTVTICRQRDFVYRKH